MNGHAEVAALLDRVAVLWTIGVDGSEHPKHVPGDPRNLSRRLTCIGALKQHRQLRHCAVAGEILIPGGKNARAHARCAPLARGAEAPKLQQKGPRPAHRLAGAS